MAAYFLDTSAVVKRYIQETGSAWVRALADPLAAHLIYLAGITDVEATSAVIRRQRGGAISTLAAAAMLRQFRQDQALEYRIIDVNTGLLAAATLLVEKHGLRAYDSVQLAAAVALNHQRLAAGTSAVTLVSADQELNAAAAVEGLSVDDPNLHP